MQTVDAPSGKLVVKRTSPHDIKMRDLYVIIDEGAMETVLFGKSLEVDLPPGRHKLKVTNRLNSRSDEFELQAGETVTYMAANEKGGCLSGILFVVGGTAGYKATLTRS